MKYYSLSECVSIQRGLTFKKSDVVDNSNFRVLRSNNIDYETYSFIDKDFSYLNPNLEIEDKYFTKKNDIIICMSTGSKKHLGKTALVSSNSKYVVGGFLSKISANEEIINSKYLFYFLKNPKTIKLIHSSVSSMTINNLRKDVLNNLQIPVPSLQEQEKIVERLDKFFENIDTVINQKITLNNQYKKYINSYIEKEIFQEKNQVMLKDLINVKRENIKNYIDRFVGLENIVSNTSEVVNVESMAVKSNTYKFNKGSLLYGRLRPYLNKVTIVDFDGHCSTEIIPIETTKELNIKYLKYFLMTQKTVNKINVQTKGARMPRASVSVLENLKIDLKNEKEQSKNVEIFDNITTLIQNIVKVNLKIIENSNQLKKLVLNKEFSYE